MAPKAVSGTPQGFDPNNPNKAIPNMAVNPQGQFVQFTDPKWSNWLNNSGFGQKMLGVQNGQYMHTPVLPNSPAVSTATVPGIGAMPVNTSAAFQSPTPQMTAPTPVQMQFPTTASPMQRPLAQRNLASLNQFQNPFLRS